METEIEMKRKTSYHLHFRTISSRKTLVFTSRFRSSGYLTWSTLGWLRISLRSRIWAVGSWSSGLSDLHLN